MFKKFLYLAVLCIGLYAQTQEWVSRYNGPANGNDEGRSIAIDASGNIYVTGFCVVSGAGEDYVTIKYNSSGDTLWVRRYNGPGNSTDRGLSVTVDASGNVYVTGYSAGSASGWDYATIKYNSSGVQQWVARYNGPGNSDDEALAVTVDLSGNVYVTGRSLGSGTGTDIATVKYNSSGVQQWAARYDGPASSFDNGFSLAVDNSGNVYVTGFSIQTLTNGYDVITIKYNSSGVQQWASTYNGSASGSNDEGRKLTIDGSGNVYVTGWIVGSSTARDVVVIKYNSSGDTSWVRTYNGTANGNDEGRDIFVDGSGNVYITGFVNATGASNNYITIKYNPSGVQQWATSYNGPGNGDDNAHALFVDNSGNVYVTGTSVGSSTSYDYATLKYNSSGSQVWLARYSGTTGINEDRAFSIALNSAGDIYITGRSFGSGTNLDVTTIKYSQSVGLTKITDLIPGDFNLNQNYPNPFNPITKISFDIPEATVVKVVIYDVSGREISVPVNQLLKAGSYEFTFDGADLSSGIYFYKLIAGEYIKTRKMVLMK